MKHESLYTIFPGRLLHSPKSIQLYLPLTILFLQCLQRSNFFTHTQTSPFFFFLSYTISIPINSNYHHCSFFWVKHIFAILITSTPLYCGLIFYIFFVSRVYRKIVYFLISYFTTISLLGFYKFLYSKK